MITVQKSQTLDNIPRYLKMVLTKVENETKVEIKVEIETMVEIKVEFYWRCNL